MKKYMRSVVFVYRGIDYGYGKERTVYRSKTGVGTAGVSVDELNAFENSDKREQIERCNAHLFVTFIRDPRFTCENGPWVITGCGESEEKEENQ